MSLVEVQPKSSLGWKDIKDRLGSSRAGEVQPKCESKVFVNGKKDLDMTLMRAP
jgi:hypothetical protein